MTSIISLTVSSDRRAIIADAVRSAEPYVDTMLLLRLTDGTDNTSATLQEFVRAANGKHELAAMPLHQDGMTMAKIRNIALRMAANPAEHDWAMVLDTDERMQFGALTRDELHSILASVPVNVDVLYVRSTTGYSKPRFFRLPVTGQYVGSIHEDWRGGGDAGVLEGVTFRELPKKGHNVTPEHLAALRQELEREPNNARWHYYAGAAYEAKGSKRKAATHYHLAVMNAERGSELQKWSRYRLLLVASEKGEAYYRLCTESLAYDPCYPEFLCRCAIAAGALGLWKDVEEWAFRAWTCGGQQALSNRTFFCDADCLFDYPVHMILRADQETKTLSDITRGMWRRCLDDLTRAKHQFLGTLDSHQS